MTDKSNFSASEWGLLLQAPMNVGALITLSSPAIGDALKESMAIAKEIAAIAQTGGSNAVLNALVSDFQDRETMKQAQPRLETKDPASATDELLGNVAGAVAVLDANASAQEAAEVKQWLYDLAVAAADAAKEGDFMGIGGEKINDKERAMLQRIADTLGL